MATRLMAFVALLLITACAPQQVVEEPPLAMAVGKPEVSWEVVNRFRVVAKDDEAMLIADYKAILQRLEEADARSRRPEAEEDEVFARLLAARVANGPASRQYATAWDPAKANYADGFATSKTRTVRLRAIGAGTCAWRIDSAEPVDGCVRDVDMDLGDHRVILDADGHGPQEVDVKVSDLLMVSLGDSYASGEGVPHLYYRAPDAQTWGRPAMWWDRRCHRSLFSGPALAALKLAEKDPHRSVTFMSFACSGATVNQGLLGYYEGAEGLAMAKGTVRLHQLAEGFYPQEYLPPQVDALARALCPVGKFDEAWGKCAVGLRHPDLLTISVGGNDLSFSNIVSRFLLTKCDKKCQDVIARQAKEDGATLVAGYGRLNDRLGGEIKPNHVLITEYPDPTLRAAFKREHLTANAEYGNLPEDAPENDFCGGFDPEHPTLFDLGFRKAESKAAYEKVIRPLANLVATAASANHWQKVGGLAAGSSAYCERDSWFNDISASLSRQWNFNGSMHPNFRGQEHYAQKILQMAETLPDSTAVARH